VRRQAALLSEASVAVLADKRLLPSVYTQVLRQVALLVGLIPTVHVLALVHNHFSASER
jgi:hypothetical protein